MPRKPTQDWSAHRAVERPVEKFSPHADYTLALAYANDYHIGMSSLAFQRVYELVQRTPEWTCERFFADGTGTPVSVELDTPLSAFGAIAWPSREMSPPLGNIRMGRFLCTTE